MSRVSALPRDYGRLEVGTRWLGNKLTLGGAMRYFGKSIRATAEERYIDGTTGEIPAMSGNWASVPSNKPKPLPDSL